MNSSAFYTGMLEYSCNRLKLAHLLADAGDRPRELRPERRRVGRGPQVSGSARAFRVTVRGESRGPTPDTRQGGSHTPHRVNTMMKLFH